MEAYIRNWKVRWVLMSCVPLASACGSHADNSQPWQESSNSSPSPIPSLSPGPSPSASPSSNPSPSPTPSPTPSPSGSPQPMGWTYFPGEESTAIQVDGAGRIFIGSDVGSLRTSADHGVSWAAVPGVAPGILSLGRNSRGQILAGLGYGPGYAGLCNPAGCQVATGIQASARVSSFTLLPSGSVVAITGWASDIWISTDQGSSYSKRSTISLNGEGIAITSDAQGILYAGGEFDGVYRSLDGGMSWAAFGLQERCGIQAFAFNASGELLASCPSSVPIRRLRNGAWTGSSLGVPAYWLVSDLLSLRDGRIAATACRNGIAAIYLSSDGGATWTDQSPPAGVVGCPRLAEHPLGYLFATSKTGVHRLRLR